MKAVDLFSGPGGFALGMKRAGIFPTCCIDFSKDAMETFSAHSPECTHYCSDIRTINLSLYRDKVDIVYGGPPCQPFSTGGLGKGKDDLRNMIPDFVEALKTIRPYCFLMENVPGLARKSNKYLFENILATFTKIGYKVNWNILNSADYGVPQKRRRLFIIGCKDRILLFPTKTHGEDTLLSHIPTGSFISKEQPIGIPPSSGVKYAKYPDMRPSPYAGHIYNGGGRPINLEEPCHTILASAGGYKTHWVDTLDIAVGYHRYLFSGGAPRDGFVEGARRLSVEESALIQSFPPGMKFFGSRSSQYTQVGDAVPPVLAEAIGRSLINQTLSCFREDFAFLPAQEHQIHYELPCLEI